MVVNSIGQVVASLRTEVFSQICKLKPAKTLLNSQYLDHFHQLNPNKLKAIKKWYPKYVELKGRCKKTYPLHSFLYVFHLSMTLISRLYGEVNRSQFKVEWIPIAMRIIESWTIFNWTRIISMNIMKVV